MDLNIDKIGCGLKSVGSRNITDIAMDSLDPEVVNQEYSPVSNPDPLLTRRAEVKDLSDFNEAKASVTCDCKSPSRPSIIPNLEETDYFVLNKENEKPSKLLDKDLKNSEYDNLEVLKASNKSDINTSLIISTQSKPDEPLNNKPEDNLKDIIKDEVVGHSDPHFDVNGLKEKIFCSTPVASKESFTSEHTQPDATTDFGQMSPLDTINIKSRMNLKRKSCDLECIKEVNEDSSDACIEKKVRLSESPVNSNIKSEAPSKSILKKCQPSCSSPNPSSSYFILDEYIESNLEDTTKPIADVAEPPTTGTDDFEVACKSLTEELIKSSLNIDTLEKYHPKVQFKNKINDEKFDEVVEESTFIKECDEKTLSLLPKEETEQTITDNTLLKKKKNSLSTETDKVIKATSNSNFEDDKTVFKREKLDTSNNSSAGASSSVGKSTENVNTMTSTEPVSIENVQPETSKTNKVELSDINNIKNSDQKSDSQEMSMLYGDEKDMTMDEEDFLLEEDLSAKKKPYVFFEFVSNDPKENEDNYNPEWQKLGRLTSDEERFKAVRDRWRSLVPPDPNKDLTFRQWRERNRKPPLNLPSLNNNHQMYDDNEKNQLCTAIFQMKIDKIQQDFMASKNKILHKRDIKLKELERSQNMEKTRLHMRGGSSMDIEIMHKRHMEQRRQLNIKHEQEIQRIKNITDGKARIFHDASNEVILFQKFYKGVGASDEVCLYLTDIQVQELVETEEMLEQYTSFYK